MIMKEIIIKYLKGSQSKLITKSSSNLTQLQGTGEALKLAILLKYTYMIIGKNLKEILVLAD